MLTPVEVRIRDYPQLKLIAWNRRGDDLITESDALALYERNWRHVDEKKMPPKERAFLKHLVSTHGRGVLHRV
jgi:hypothetical protein